MGERTAVQVVLLTERLQAHGRPFRDDLLHVLAAKPDQSKAPSLQRVVLRAFSGTTDLCQQLRTTNGIEQVFVEVRRRPRSLVCFVNVASVDHSSYSIFHRVDLQWRNRTLQVLHKPLDISPAGTTLDHGLVQHQSICRSACWRTRAHPLVAQTGAQFLAVMMLLLNVTA